MQNKRIVVALIDKVAADFLGPLHLFRHPAPAIRMFTDLCTQQTAVAQHIADHELRIVGILDDATLEIEPRNELLISGEQWLASQNTGENKE